MSRVSRLGLFIITTLLILGIAVFWIGSKDFLFRSTYQLNAAFQNVSGLTEGAEVRVGGIHQGTVKEINLPRQPNGKVTVVMDLKKDTHGVIKSDSIATISSEGLVGDKFVEVSFGSENAAPVKNGDTIQSQQPLEIADLVKKANDILDSAGGAMNQLSEAVTNVNSISAKINDGKGTVGALINNQSVFNNVNAGVSAFHENMEALKHNFLLRGFFKDRGYEDQAELTKDAIGHLPSGAAERSFRLDADKLFDKPDTAKLKKANMLDESGKYLETNSFALAVIAVSAGPKGDTDKDRMLTQARAAVIRDYLVQHFKIEDKKLKTIGLGKSTDANEDSRVDLIVYPLGQKVETGPTKGSPLKAAKKEGPASGQEK